MTEETVQISILPNDGLLMINYPISLPYGKYQVRLSEYGVYHVLPILLRLRIQGTSLKGNSNNDVVIYNTVANTGTISSTDRFIGNMFLNGTISCQLFNWEGVLPVDNTGIVSLIFKVKKID